MKKISSNIYEFDPQIYPQLLWIAVNPTEEEQGLFTSTYIDPEEDLKVDLDGAHAVVNHVRIKDGGRTGNIITFSSIKDIKPSHIAHESNHVVMNLCSFCDIKLHCDNQEPISYLMGWVADCCDKVRIALEVDGITKH